jgi:hypothetical protein
VPLPLHGDAQLDSLCALELKNKITSGHLIWTFFSLRMIFSWVLLLFPEVLPQSHTSWRRVMYPKCSPSSPLLDTRPSSNKVCYSISYRSTVNKNADMNKMQIKSTNRTLLILNRLENTVINVQNKQLTRLFTGWRLHRILWKAQTKRENIGHISAINPSLVQFVNCACLVCSFAEMRTNTLSMSK